MVWLSAGWKVRAGCLATLSRSRLVVLEETAIRDVLVVFNTGTGLKYPKIPGLRVP